jgi:hypothetical protein
MTLHEVIEGMSPFVANLNVQLNSPLADFKVTARALLENDLNIKIMTNVMVALEGSRGILEEATQPQDFDNYFPELDGSLCRQVKPVVAVESERLIAL